MFLQGESNADVVSAVQQQQPATQRHSKCQFTLMIDSIVTVFGLELLVFVSPLLRAWRGYF